MVQWIRICLPIQETQGWSLSRKIPYAMEQLSPGTTTDEAHVPQSFWNKRSHAMRSAIKSSIAIKSSPWLSQPEKATVQQQRPRVNKIKLTIKKKTQKIYFKKYFEIILVGLWLEVKGTCVFNLYPLSQTFEQKLKSIFFIYDQYLFKTSCSLPRGLWKRINDSQASALVVLPSNSSWP